MQRFKWKSAAVTGQNQGFSCVGTEVGRRETRGKKGAADIVCSKQLPNYYILHSVLYRLYTVHHIQVTKSCEKRACKVLRQFL